MTREVFQQILAIIVITGSVFVWAIDALVELDINPAIRVKWSLAWYSVRYLASFAAVLLSIDILI